MELILFTILSGLAGLFALTAGLSKDRTNLIPSGLILLILGIFLVIGPGLQIQDGVNYTYGEVNGSQEVFSESFTYQTVEAPVNIEWMSFNGILGVSLIAISLYFLIIAMANTNFRSTIMR